MTLFFFSIQLLCASGASESRFKYIDELIAQKEYNQALVLLEEYIRVNPADFDSAQKRIKKIMGARGDYNMLAGDLIDVLITDPTNDEKKLKMISDLERMEPNPNIGTQEFIAQTKAAAQFTYFRAYFEKIMREGSRLVNEEQFTEASDMFYSGFELYRDDFYAQGYPSSFVDPINGKLAKIAEILPAYKNIQDKLVSAVQAYNSAVSAGNFQASQTAFVQVVSVMSDFAVLRNDTANAGWLFQSSFAELLRANPGITEASYLPFLYRFTLGRGSDPQTGILGAMDGQWNALVSAMKNTGVGAIHVKWQTAFDSIKKQGLLVPPASHGAARGFFEEASSFARQNLQVNTLYSLLEKSPGEFYEDENTEYRAGMETATALAVIADRELDVALSFAQASQKNAAFTLPAAAAADIQTNNQENFTFLLQSADLFTQYAQESAHIASDASTLYQTYQSIYGEQNPPDFSFEFGGILALCSQIEAAGTHESSLNVLKFARYVSGGASLLAADYEKSLSDSLALLNGETEKSGRYPAEASEAMQRSLAAIQRDSQNLGGLYASLSALSVTEDLRTEFGTELVSIQKDMETMQSVSRNGQNLITRAAEQTLLAGKALQEAEMRYNQAAVALQRSEYQNARESLQLSRQRYNQSLEYQESEQLRTTADARLASLGENITRAENEVVVVQVRNFINQAKSAYYTGNFESADRLLNQAKTRWEITNIEENPEITQWLTLTGTAIARKTGRTIPVTAPMYPEMSQLLSVANQLYEQGQILIKDGKRNEALAVLETAKQKIREVQLVYPINQEAGLLALKIDQLIDPANFQTVFKRRFEQAMTDYKKSDLQQTAYADLLDLAQINQNYPGLQSAINTVEIYLGMRLPPPDPRSIARSAALITQAKSAANSANEVTLRTAIAQLDEALRLTPDNGEAALLKDRLQNRVGGQAVAVLSAESEQLFQQAVQELQRNNVINAAALLAQLMSDPKSKKSPKVLDLQQRINVLTGQTN